MRRHQRLRWLAVLCVVALCVLPAASALAATDNGMIRVWLSSIRSNTTYDLTLTGTYSVAGQTLGSGSTVKVEFSGGIVYVTAGGVRTAMGTSLTLARQSGGVTIRQGLAPSNVYPGDFRFFYSGSTAYVVCTLRLEDYLYGVLPYEMDNSFPLEALKAQAVAARTYAVFSRRGSSLYDVTDTTTHQVFRGVASGNARCAQAVDETRGMVLMYGGAYIEASFGASNGGQTETRANAWGSSAVPYQAVQEDPYDAANLRSSSKSYLIYKTPSQGTSTAAYQMLAEALAQKYGGVAGGYTINEITGVVAHTPRYAEPSRLYTRLRVTLRYNGNATDTVDIPIFPTVKTALGIGINSTDNELITVAEEAGGYRVTARRYGHGIGLSQRGAQQRANQGQGYQEILSFYYPNTTLTRVDFVDSWAGTSPGGTTPGEVLPSQAPTPIEGTNARVVLSNPSGRVNMRQAPSLQGGLIATIPHGATVKVIGETGAWYQIEYGALTGYVASEYLVLEQAPPSGSTETAYVTLKSGRLNLRSEARATAGIISTIANGTQVGVLERGASWCKVQAGTLTGYVMTQYLTGFSGGSATPGGVDPSTDEVAVVMLANPLETLNLRMNPSTGAPILARLAHGTALLVVERGGTWTKVAYQGLLGYVMNGYVRFEGTGEPVSSVSPSPSATPSALPGGETWRAVVTTSGGVLNLRSAPNTAAYIAARIPNGATLTVTRLGDTWCEVTYQQTMGYVMRRYLYVETAVPGPSPVQSAGQVQRAWVRTANGGGVNIRSTPSMRGDIVGAAPYGAEITVLSGGADWTYGRYAGVTGYIASGYLLFDAAVTPTPTPTPSASIPPAATESQAWVVTSNQGNLNVRLAPSSQGGIAGSIPYGAQVTIVVEDAQWPYVRYGQLEGFVAGGYLSKTAPAGQPQASAPATGSTSGSNLAWVRTAGGGVNIRNAPNGDIIATAPYGAEVAVFSNAEGWSSVQYGTTFGYIATSYLTAQPVVMTAPSSGALPSAAPSVGMAIADDEAVAWVWAPDKTSIGLRNAAGGAVFLQLPHGTQVAVVEADDSDWAFIRFGDTYGYIQHQYLDDIAP